MDKTELYIKMCDCPEIQEQCVLRPVLPKEGIILDGNYVWVIVKKDIGKKKSIDSRLDNKSIWLPRQDQIQEMMKFDDISHLVFDLKEFSRTFYKSEKRGKDTIYHRASEMFDSMEQLWLAFYMYKKHEKLWNGKEWEKKA